MTQIEPGQTPPPSPTPPPQGGGGITVRNWTVIAHLSAFSGIVTAGLGCVVGPLLVWLLKGKDDPRIEAHAKAALNFQISMLIYMIVPLIFTFTIILMFIGLPLMSVLGLFDLVCVIIATVKASNGEMFNYPFSLKLIK